MTSARLLEERRRKRDRRDARERAYREHVCGGPLVDTFEPIIGGGTDAEHAAMVATRVAAYAARVQAEGQLLAIDFARRCWVTRRDEIRMLRHWAMWNQLYGPPGPVPMHSTSPGTPTTGDTIPAL